MDIKKKKRRLNVGGNKGNITEQQPLQFEAHSLSKFPEENPNPVMRVSSHGRLLYANRPARKLLAALKWRTGQSLPGQIRLSAQIAFNNKTRQELELSIPAGRTYSFILVPIIKDGYANLYGYDITERKQLEEELKRTNEKLEERVKKRTDEVLRERQRLYRVLETLPAYVVLLTPDYHVSFANRFFRERFGESHGKRCYEYLFNRSEPCENCETYKVLKTGKTHRWEWTGPDGRNYDIYDFPFTDTDGSPLIMEMGIDITERKRAEAELKRHRDNLEALVNERTKDLRESEQRLNRSQEIAHLGSWELDLVNNRLTWSDEVYKIFGLKPREFGATYEAFLEAVHSDDRAAVDAAYSGSLREKRDTYEIEHRVIRKSTGEVRIVHEKCEHVRDETGRIIRSVGMVHDVTERKQFEEALRHGKEQWERTFDSVPDMIAIIDNQYRIVQANAAMARRLGLKPAECAGLPCYKYVHGLSQPPDFCPHSRTLKDSRQHVVEVHEDRLGGDFLVSTTPLFDDKGKMTGSVHVARDITERKLMERREKEALAITISARTAMDTLQAMGEGVLLMDMNGHILSINPALEQLSGYQKEQVLGKPLTYFLPAMLQENDRPMAYEAYQSALKGKDVELPPITLISKQGCSVPVIPAVAFIYASDGKPTAIVLTMRDISEMRAMQKNLEENNIRLRALAARLSSTEERERRRISAQIHDTVIQTLSLSNIKLGALLKELTDNGVKNSVASVKAIRATIEDAIRESRSLMAELTPPLLYELGLVPAINDLAQKLQKQHDKPIQVKDDEQPKTIDKATQGILFQATRELVLNALKHAGKCAITITVSRENDRLRICVEDNGTGFTAPEQGRFVFHNEGGFGLFTIRERLEGIRGTMEISSRPGAGTSVTLYAPLALVKLPAARVSP